MGGQQNTGPRGSGVLGLPWTSWEKKVTRLSGSPQTPYQQTRSDPRGHQKGSREAPDSTTALQ
eukprot:9085651-Pyramimonas_sp.AAC.1